MSHEEAVEVKLKIPKAVDEWLRARGYGEKEYQRMFDTVLVGELEYLDREGTAQLRKMLEKDGAT